MLQFQDCSQRTKRIGMALVILWNLGLFFGISIMLACSGSWEPLILEASGCSVGLLGILGVTVLPTAASIVAVMMLGVKCVWVLCSIRSLVMGMCIGAIGIACGRGAPIMTALLLFSGLVSSPILLLFWYRRLTEESRKFVSDSAILLAANLIISSVDYWIISPFLVDVINF